MPASVQLCRQRLSGGSRGAADGQAFDVEALRRSPVGRCMIMTRSGRWHRQHGRRDRKHEQNRGDWCVGKPWRGGSPVARRTHRWRRRCSQPATYGGSAEGGALRNGLADVDTLVFISSDGEGARVLAHHLNVVAAARACGVTHIVALSGVDADVDSPFCYAVTNGFTEQAIRESGCGFCIVRASIFAEFFRHFLLPARTTGQLSVPAGDGRIGLVSKGDVGRCLAALARCGQTGRCHEATGPAALDAAAIAATAAQAWVRPVVYRPISAAAYMAQTAGTE